MIQKEFCTEYMEKKQAEAEIWKRGTCHCQLLLDGVSKEDTETCNPPIDNLTAYELSLLQENLIVKCAILQSNLFHYMKRNRVDMNNRREPLVIIYGMLWEIKRQILGVETRAELERIQIEYECVQRFYRGLQE